MARLFITQREIDFISDITKEIIKDVNGQFIIYYPISELKTKSDPVYDEAIRKIFDHPIKIEAMVDGTFPKDTIVNQFGIDKDYKIEVFVQYRDMIEKGIEPTIGDYFTFGGIVFELTEVRNLRAIYGQAEYSVELKLIGSAAREQSIELLIKGPTDISHTDGDAVQDKFYQQRGYSSNAEGDTADKRALVDRGVIDKPLTGPKEVTGRGDLTGRNAFYGDDE